MARREIFDVTVSKVAETDKAWRLTDGTKVDWFPKSQCELEENRGSTTFTLTAPVWLLKEKGFL